MIIRGLRAGGSAGVSRCFGGRVQPASRRRQPSVPDLYDLRPLVANFPAAFAYQWRDRFKSGVKPFDG